MTAQERCRSDLSTGHRIWLLDGLLTQTTDMSVSGKHLVHRR